VSAKSVRVVRIMQTIHFFMAASCAVGHSRNEMVLFLSQCESSL
jgi:hypothetical protein